MSVDLFQLGDFTLHSGEHSNFKIDCDALTDDDLATLAAIAHPLLPKYSSVIGVPQGGLRFADALRKYAVGENYEAILADDVFTTGTSLREYRQNGSQVAVVIFARDLTPWWVEAIFDLNMYMRDV